jgi:glycosyltransferase involved in cell wall biosynthesis
VFVQVSESEGGLAASIQEALAQGLPVIATDVGGVSALGHDPELFPGLLEPDHTTAEFARRLEELLTAADEEYERYAAASMAFWQTHCSADRLASAFAQRLRGIADAPANVAAGADPSR